MKKCYIELIVLIKPAIAAMKKKRRLLNVSIRVERKVPNVPVGILSIMKEVASRMF
ncbi:hypothetical protein ABC255_02670 [Neobacillus sp. 3P2-tot-E-2]|uniref:hypothetical protein n=1 Tax=Neobacillus sp. 3P2-tot-E-2 TaxID=3132212 RepID=UPI0039A2129D